MQPIHTDAAITRNSDRTIDAEQGTAAVATTEAANGTPVPSTASSAAILKAQGFPEADLPALLQTIEGSVSIRPVLIEDLKNKFSHLGKGATKTIIDACISIYAEKLSKRQGGKWVIKAEHRGRAGLASA